MARITPKTNWVAGNIPVSSDFNRIESNSQQAFDELDAEVAARVADVNAEEAARIADVNAEEARALGAEAALQTNIDSVNADLGGLDFVNGNAGTYGSKVIDTNERWIPPSGTYIFVVASIQGILFQIYTGSEWAGFGTGTDQTNGYAQMTVDGVNFSYVGSNVSLPGTVYYRKLA